MTKKYNNKLVKTQTLLQLNFFKSNFNITGNPKRLQHFVEEKMSDIKTLHCPLLPKIGVI